MKGVGRMAMHGFSSKQLKKQWEKGSKKLESKNNKGLKGDITKPISENSFKLPENFLSSANQNWGNDLTKAGRALQKHADREGSVFQDIKFSHKTANEDGLALVKSIVDSKEQIITPAKNGGTFVFDKITGKGFGISREGVFNGFRELFTK